MGFMDKVAGLFSKSSREESLLLKGVDLAKGKHPEQAIAIYNDLLTSPATAASIKARALFNRALAYSSMKDDDRAVADLEAVLKMPGVPDNVESAARSQVIRVKKRNEVS